MSDTIREIGLCEVTIYRWRREYGGTRADQLKRLKDLEKENERLSHQCTNDGTEPIHGGWPTTRARQRYGMPLTIIGPKARVTDSGRRRHNLIAIRYFSLSGRMSWGWPLRT